MLVSSSSLVVGISFVLSRIWSSAVLLNFWISWPLSRRSFPPLRRVSFSHELGKLHSPNTDVSTIIILHVRCFKGLFRVSSDLSALLFFSSRDFICRNRSEFDPQLSFYTSGSADFCLDGLVLLILFEFWHFACVKLHLRGVGKRLWLSSAENAITFRPRKRSVDIFLTRTLTIRNVMLSSGS